MGWECGGEMIDTVTVGEVELLEDFKVYTFTNDTNVLMGVKLGFEYWHYACRLFNTNSNWNLAGAIFG